MPKPARQQYRIRNWKEYNTALKQRGKLTFWVSEEVRGNWLSKEKTGRRGASPSYTDMAIATMGTIQSLFHLAGRQTQGFLESLFELIGVDLSVPDHSTLSRRLGKLEVELPIIETGFAHHVVVDSTEVKVYGEGEWLVRQHGNKERRTWRKLHLGVDEATGEILAAVVSTNNVSDGAVLPELLPSIIIGKIEQVSADGAYDQRSCYDAIANRQAQAAKHHHVKERDFTKEVVALQSHIQEMKICAVLSKSDAQNGNMKSNIIDAQSLKIPFLVSKVSLVAS